MLVLHEDRVDGGWTANLSVTLTLSFQYLQQATYTLYTSIEGSKWAEYVGLSDVNRCNSSYL